VHKTDGYDCAQPLRVRTYADADTVEIRLVEEGTAISWYKSAICSLGAHSVFLGWWEREREEGREGEVEAGEIEGGYLEEELGGGDE